MKNLHILLIAILFLSSCSSDDTGTNISNNNNIQYKHLVLSVYSNPNTKVSYTHTFNDGTTVDNYFYLNSPGFDNAEMLELDNASTTRFEIINESTSLSQMIHFEAYSGNGTGGYHEWEEALAYWTLEPLESITVEYDYITNQYVLSSN